MKLQQADVILNKQFTTKEEAIRYAGELMVERGYVTKDYIEKMIDRDKITSVFIGNKVAIPHGTEDAGAFIKRSGIVVVQVPNGVDFDSNTVNVLIGIAGADGEHLDLLSSIAIICSDIDNVHTIIQADTAEKIIELFHTKD